MIYLVDASGKHPMTEEQAIQYVKSYKIITKYSDERLLRTLKYQIKGVSIDYLLREAKK